MPFLRAGHIVGARDRVALAPRVVVCQCTRCLSEPTNITQDGLSGNIVRGRLVGINEYREHRALDRFQKLHDRILPETPGVPIPVTPETIAFSASSSPVLVQMSRTQEQSLIFVDAEPEPDVTPNETSNETSSNETRRRRTQPLNSILEDAFTRRSCLPSPQVMVFERPPSYTDELRSDPAAPLDPPSEGRDALPLACDHLVNHPFLDYQTWLCDTVAEVEARIENGYGGSRTRCGKVLNVLHEDMLAFQQAKEQEWRRQDFALQKARAVYQAGGRVIDTARYIMRAPVAGQFLRNACFLLVAALHLLCAVSVDQCRFLLLMLQLILDLQTPEAQSGQADGSSSLSPSPRVRLPKAVLTVLLPLNLEPVTCGFVCCPQCYCCYPLDKCPVLCGFQQTPSSPACARALRQRVMRKGHIREPPCRKFLYHDFKEWIGRLICRPGMEKLLDRDVHPTDADEVMRDIWDGDVLREFRGPDGRHFTVKDKHSDGRYVFSLCMDNFNPFFTRAGGKSVSCGAIYLVCLNLPPHIRYLLENMFLVCVIPGPHEPSMWQINHLLRPLIDDLLIFWSPGIWFTKSHDFAKGRLIRCAVVPVVSDLRAARQLAGQAPVTAKHFCQFCDLSYDQIDTVKPQWGPRRSREQYMALARAWRDAPNETARRAIYAGSGIWWSELLRLPYWDPTRYVVIDTMHNLLLGNLDYHCRQLWGMNVHTADGDGLNMAPAAVPRKANSGQVSIARACLQGGYTSDLQRLPAYVLRELCVVLGLGGGGKGPELIRKLTEYRWQLGWADEHGTPYNVDPALHPSVRSGVSEGEAAVAETYLSSFPKTSLSQLRPEALTDMLRRHSQALNVAVEWDSMTRKPDVINALCSLKELEEERAHPLPPPAPKTAVLGRRTLEAVHLDISNMSLPSWIGRVPADLGDPRHGKLTADQWRTACTVILMASLPHIWNTSDGAHDRDRFRAMLDNFVDLIHATTLATARTLTKDRIEDFHRFMYQYLVTAKQLYPDMTLRPNHHFSLHLREMFYDFGPSHAWRCYAFERYNSVLQHIKTSGKSGEMEVTMLRRCCMMQNIRATFSYSEFPGALARAKAAFESVFTDKNRGTLFNDIFAYDDPVAELDNTSRRTHLDRTVFELFRAYAKSHPHVALSPTGKVLVQNTTTRFGIRYSSKAASSQDCNVVFGDINADWRAGKIMTIFVPALGEQSTVRPTEVFAVVRPFAELSTEDSLRDPYLRYRMFKVAGKLYYSHESEEDTIIRLSDTIIRLSDVVCHCACTRVRIRDIESECLHVLPLTRD